MKNTLKKEHSEQIDALYKTYLPYFTDQALGVEDVLKAACDLYNRMKEVNLCYHLLPDENSVDEVSVYYIAKKIITANEALLRRLLEATGVAEKTSPKVTDTQVLVRLLSERIKHDSMVRILALEPHGDDMLGSTSGIVFANPDAVRTTLYTIARSGDKRDTVDLSDSGSREGIPTRRRFTIAQHHKCMLPDYHYDLRLQEQEIYPYQFLVEHYTKHYADAQALVSKIEEAFASLLSAGNQEKYVVLPLGIEHPMHILTAYYGTQCAIKHNLQTRLIYCVDHPYDAMPQNAKLFPSAVQFYGELLHCKLIRADDTAVDQTQSAKILKGFYGDVYYGHFAGTLEKTTCSYFMAPACLQACKNVFPMHVNNILYVTPQALPFLKTGGLGNVAFSYVKALGNSVNQVAIMMPKYKRFMKQLALKYDITAQIGDAVCKTDYSDNGDVLVLPPSSDRQNDKEKITLLNYNPQDKGFHIKISNVFKRCRLEKYEYQGVIYYLVDIEGCFDSENVFDSKFADRDYAAFCLAVMRSLQNELDFMPTVLHCNDNQTALVPFLRKLKYPNYLPELKTMYSIHFYGYKGIYSKQKMFTYLGISEEDCDYCFICEKSKSCIFDLVKPYCKHDIEKLGIPDDKISLMKVGICFADTVTTVSKGYAEQIKKYPDFASIKKLYGIRNGVETPYYKFEQGKNGDAYINQTKNNWPEAKKHNKKAFQAEFGLAVDEAVPMFCMVARMNGTKGIDDIKNTFDQLMELDLQLVIVGEDDKLLTNDGKSYTPYADFFTAKQKVYPQKFFYSPFSEEMEFKTYSASDVLIMPSREEACGTTQINAMKYGVLPIVSFLDSFKDTVIDYNKAGEGENYLMKSAEDMDKGIGFYTIKDDCWILFDVIKMLCNKLRTEEKNKKWRKAVRSSVEVDFSWENGSIRKYLDLYNGWR